MISVFLTALASAVEPSEQVVQIWVSKQSIQSIALSRLQEEEGIPIYIQAEQRTEWGTGVWIAPNQLLTNYHVIQGAKNLGVQAIDSSIMPAQIILAYPDLDLAWLAVEGIDAPVWKQGDSVELGQNIWTGGFAESLTWTQRSARVIAVDRMDLLEDERQSFTVIDQNVPPGYSGGPVWNQKGELIGLMTATSERKQESYFISIADIETAWTQKMNWEPIGFRLQGRRIISVLPSSPLEDSVGREIQGINQRHSSLEEISLVLKKGNIGEEVEIFFANGQSKRIQIQPILEWRTNPKEECLWRGAGLNRDGKDWTIQSFEEGSPLRTMGALPGDRLKIQRNCEELSASQGTEIIVLEREGQECHIIVPYH